MFAPILRLWYVAEAVIQGNLQVHFVNEAQLLQAKQPSNPDESAEQAVYVHKRMFALDGDKLAECWCLQRHMELLPYSSRQGFEPVKQSFTFAQRLTHTLLS